MACSMIVQLNKGTETESVKTLLTSSVEHMLYRSDSHRRLGRNDLGELERLFVDFFAASWNGTADQT